MPYLFIYSCLCSWAHMTHRENNPAHNWSMCLRILGATVWTGELLPSLVGGGTVPALPRDLAEQWWHFDVIGGVFVCVFVRWKNTYKNICCCDIGWPVISFEPPVLQRWSTYGRNPLVDRKKDIMLGTCLCPRIRIKSKKQPLPMYAFCVILIFFVGSRSHTCRKWVINRYYHSFHINWYFPLCPGKYIPSVKGYIPWTGCLL